MAQAWHADVLAAVRTRNFKLFHFIDIEVATPIYLTTYHGDITVNGNDYVSTLVASVEKPPRTGAVTQEVQRIGVTEALNAFTGSDFITQLGDYHGAQIIITTYIESVAGVLLTDAAKVFSRSDGLLKHVFRKPDDGLVILEITNSYGKLDALEELRTTSGSWLRRAPLDTSMGKADAVTQDIAFEWGS